MNKEVTKPAKCPRVMILCFVIVHLFVFGHLLLTKNPCPATPTPTLKDLFNRCTLFLMTPLQCPPLHPFLSTIIVHCTLSFFFFLWIKHSSRIAVTVLHQPHPGLPFTLDNMVVNLPMEWRIQVFITPEMTSLLMQTPRIRRHIDTGKVFLTPTINSSMGYVAYSMLLWSEEFWNQVQGQCQHEHCGGIPIQDTLPRFFLLFLQQQESMC